MLSVLQQSYAAPDLCTDFGRPLEWSVGTVQEEAATAWEPRRSGSPSAHKALRSSWSRANHQNADSPGLVWGVHAQGRRTRLLPPGDLILVRRMWKSATDTTVQGAVSGRGGGEERNSPGGTLAPGPGRVSVWKKRNGQSNRSTATPPLC